MRSTAAATIVAVLLSAGCGGGGGSSYSLSGSSNSSGSSGSSGSSASAAATVALSASPSTVASGGSSMLTWSSTNATACTAAGSWSGTENTSGAQSTGPLLATATYTLSCTGPGGSASQTATVAVTAVGDPKLGGIWHATGTLPDGVTSAFLMTSPTGPFFYITNAPNCTGLYFGTLSASDASGPAPFSVSGNGHFAPDPLTASTNGGCPVAQSPTFSGTITPASVMTLSGQGSGTPAFNWSFDSAWYDQPSTLAGITGIWSETVQGSTITLSIGEGGSISSTSPFDGCVLQGQASTINAGLNLYSFTFTYSSCTGADSNLNGLTGSGLITLNTSTIPISLVMGLAVPLPNGQPYVSSGTFAQQVFICVWDSFRGSGDQGLLIMDNNKLTAFGLLNGAWYGYSGTVQINGNTATGTVTYDAPAILGLPTCESCSDQIVGLQPTATVTLTTDNHPGSVVFTDNTNGRSWTFNVLSSPADAPITDLAAAQASWNTLQSGGEPTYPIYSGFGNPYPQGNNYLCGTPAPGQTVGGTISADVPALGIYILTCDNAAYNSPATPASGLVFMTTSGQIFGAYANQYLFTNVSYPAGVIP
jgi:hypothetical protein